MSKKKHGHGVCKHGNSREYICMSCVDDEEVFPAAPCSPHDLPETECEDCGWTGDAPDLISGKCPDCDSSSIIDHEPEENEERTPTR